VSDRGEEDEERHWFEDIADHVGSAYLRYSFTMGTTQEVDFLVEHLDLTPGMRVLDVGCGPGRHAHELARRAIEVVGLDVSERFVTLAAAEAPPGAIFVRGDARSMTFDGEFDAAISLCQGAFGLGGPGPFPGDPQNLGADAAVLDGIRRALRPGGRVATSAFSAYFQVRWIEDHDTFDAATGVNHEPTEIRGESGARATTDLWTTCSTPRELRMLFERAELAVDAIWSVEPGRYATDPPGIDSPEFLVLARREA
jgi:SAM-dependent methyltransferase